MSARRMLIAVGLVFGLCVWGFARSGDSPVAAHTGAPSTSEATDEDGTRGDAASRFRTNQPRHWRYVAIGNGSSH